MNIEQLKNKPSAHINAQTPIWVQAHWLAEDQARSLAEHFIALTVRPITPSVSMEFAMVPYPQDDSIDFECEEVAQ
jgi:hypothetical protein